MNPYPRVVMFLLLLCACARAQEAATAPAQPRPADAWRERASALTDDLSKDAAALGEYERVMLWARLGGAWLKDDEERARGRGRLQPRRDAEDGGADGDRRPLVGGRVRVAAGTARLAP